MLSKTFTGVGHANRISNYLQLISVRLKNFLNSKRIKCKLKNKIVGELVFSPIFFSCLVLFRGVLHHRLSEDRHRRYPGQTDS